MLWVSGQVNTMKISGSGAVSSIFEVSLVNDPKLNPACGHFITCIGFRGEIFLGLGTCLAKERCSIEGVRKYSVSA